ncbi:MAG TPA: hypothetical protein VEK11_20655 [Thermoanaerobaculia bacterium]|nr:hypothetical protein [Thermoanaerobaculia bacterium]
MADHHINCLLQKNPNALTVSLAPYRQRVGKPGSNTIVWEAQSDTTFPASDFFSWKSGGPGYIPTRSTDGKTLTLTYDNTAPATWSYMITLANDTASVVIDPDIHNDPPPTM